MADGSRYEKAVCNFSCGAMLAARPLSMVPRLPPPPDIGSEKSQSRGLTHSKVQR